MTRTMAKSFLFPDSSSIDAKLFDEFRTIIYNKSGISLGPHKIALLSSRLNKRLRILELPDYRAYLEYLQNDTSGEEIVLFLDAISTNTTNFFRESAHFDLLTELLKTWYAQGQRRFRIWSAASSSGEEPYTIAMTVAESLNLHDVDVKILATDISTKILGIAQAAVYDSDIERDVAPSLLKKYFVRHQNRSHHTYEVVDALKSLVHFRRLNLSTPPFPMKGPMDVVFCRNVMIYFDNPVRKRLVEDIHRLLKPGGYLLVGHSESLSGIKNDFKVVKPAVYIK